MEQAKGICSVCGTIHRVALDHAGWGWICDACFGQPGFWIEENQRVRQEAVRKNVERVQHVVIK